jgi:hypothetical protein
VGNAIEYECKECHYYEAIHGMNGYDYHDERFKNCNRCTRPKREDYRNFVEGRGKEKVNFKEPKEN